MKITILGTGTFYVGTKRSGPAYLLEVGDKKILIDCGPGTLMRLSEIGLSPDDIDYVLISHFHADHTSDLFAFQVNFRLKDFFSNEKDYKTPVIYGPKGIATFTKRLSKVYQLPAFDDYTKIEYKEVSPTFEIAGATVRAFPVGHAAFGVNADAYAFRFEYQGKVFVFSGDCVKGATLIEACKGADLFICDASYPGGKGGAAHMDTLDIGDIAKTSGVKSVVLSHFYPNTEEIDLVSEVKERFPGPVSRGVDLKEYKL